MSRQDDPLTACEQDVVGLVLHRASTRDITAAVHPSTHTVQDHLEAVFAQLVNSRPDLALLRLPAGPRCRTQL